MTPEQLFLRRLVAEHLDGFLAEARAQHDRPLPAYVEKELRAFVECGIPEFGFALAHCPRCGRRMAVAFSCKRRGACGSCIARRMCNATAHLADHVFPEVPVRQYVLSVPFQIRLLLARDAAAYGAVTRIFAEEVTREQRLRARALGIVGVNSAGISVQQRWGSSMNLNPHIHAAWCDGVFTRSPNSVCDGVSVRARFHALPAPTADELERAVARIHERVIRWLARHDQLADPEVAAWSNARAERTSLDACLESALGVGQLGAVDPYQIAEGGAVPPSDPDAERFDRLRRGPQVADALGWSLHAGTIVADWDRVGLERLLRYFTRPPLAQHRLALLRDGRVAYALRKPWRRGQTHRIMTPLQLIARLAALIPAPRRPLLRFHGALAPHSSWRSAVVPLSPPRPGTPPWQCAPPNISADASTRTTDADSTEAHARPDAKAPSSEANTTTPAGDLHTGAPAGTGAVKPRDRPRFSRIDWAVLLWRVHDVDALACECGARLRFVDLFIDPARARAELDVLGLRCGDGDREVTSARARAPTVDDGPVDWP